MKDYQQIAVVLMWVIQVVWWVLFYITHPNTPTIKEQRYIFTNIFVLGLMSFSKGLSLYFLAFVWAILILVQTYYIDTHRKRL